MKERGILFSAPMIRALLAGRKTVTRRLVRWRVKGFAPPFVEPGTCTSAPTWDPLSEHTVGHEHPNGVLCRAPVLRCPALPGDLLWVRETFARGVAGCDHGLSYRADHLDPRGDGPAHPMRWTPGIHMRRTESRITLRVTGVRAERLHTIDDADAVREGVAFFDPEHLGPHVTWEFGPAPTPRDVFGMLWEKINSKRAPWSSNPWVWRVAFERVEVPRG